MSGSEVSICVIARRMNAESSTTTTRTLISLLAATRTSQAAAARLDAISGVPRPGVADGPLVIFSVVRLVRS